MANEDSAHFDGYDIFSSGFDATREDRWRALRTSGCPVAHSDLWGGSWMLVDYGDMQEVLTHPEIYSSRALEIAGTVPPPQSGLVMPPVTTDPPAHAAHRDVLAGYFTAQRILQLEPFVRATASRLAGDIAARGQGEVMGDFARPLALSVLSHILNVPADNKDRFADWAMRIMRLGPTDEQARASVIRLVWGELEQLLDARREKPGDDIVSHIATASVDGEPLTRKHQIGSLMLLTVAGADTTWSSLGSSIWYFGCQPSERARVIADPQLLRTTAVEELLRYFAPVTLARITTQETEIHGRCPAANERVILPLAAANRDPKLFDDPDRVVLDRRRNRHMTFGGGPHRCLGEHLARLEMRVGLEEWFKAIPDYTLDDQAPMEWSLGQTRGPEALNIRVSAPGA